MLPELFLNNLLSWSLQVFALAALGAALPLLFRVSHPGTHLAYCHVLLIACLLLPLVQPWQHPLVTLPASLPATSDSTITPPQPVTSEPSTALDKPAAPPTSAQTPGATTSAKSPLLATLQLPFQWTTRGIIISVLVVGIALRLGWLLVGLWRIRNYRIGATPLYPIPEAVQAAASITHANALFCMSPEVAGPVTLGWLAPVVLLPESFLYLDEEAQCAIACHELLHVRRHDWLVTLIEESAGALLWFNPAIWMLLSQTRLTREQLVDAEVVRLTSAREPYIKALMTIARGRQVLDLAPAPLFLRRRHLTRRMHALLKDVSMSKLRLLSSYGSMTALLGVAIWLSLASFPLVGEPQYQQQAQITATLPANAPGPLPATKLVAQARPPVVSSVPRSQAADTTSTSNSTSMPMDVREPVTVPAQLASTPDERAAALALLERAKQGSKLHIPGTPPYALRVFFQASGELAYTGSGELTENWRTGQNWRWTAKLGSYSQVQFANGGGVLDETPVAITSLRVHELRVAIFWAVRNTPSSAEIRTAKISWNGKPTTCILFGGRTIANFGPSSTTGRAWHDEEYCFDNASGVLRVYSFVPGSYVVYGYSKNRLFHDRLLPDQITIYTGGTQTLDAQLDFADLGGTEPNAVAPNAGPLNGFPSLSLILPSRMLIATSSPATQPDLAGNSIIHASISAAGQVIESEIVIATDPSLGVAGLKSIRSGGFPHPPLARKGGPAQYDMYFDIRTGSNPAQ